MDWNETAPIEETESPVLVRTDFSDQRVWERICAVIQEPRDPFFPNTEVIDREEYEGASTEGVRQLLGDSYLHGFAFVADEATMKEKDHPVLVLDLAAGGEFRAVPSEIAAIENHLSIGKMGFEEFAEGADEDGIFRGFPLM